MHYIDSVFQTVRTFIDVLGAPQKKLIYSQIMCGGPTDHLACQILSRYANFHCRQLDHFTLATGYPQDVCDRVV